MARDLFLPEAILASPNQASNIFNPGGRHPIRQKHLFVVKFMRDTKTTNSMWREGLSFVVKSIDRPQIQPVVEEINQYNKKRIIHTGVKYSPINCTLYDTADGAAMNMWLQYARYYFGDYHQPAEAYYDDILNNEMIDTTIDKRGWGYNIRPTSDDSPIGINSQFFFNKIIVYQVWGNEYTSFELVNPKINSFSPDELAYDNSDACLIQMSLSYEAIVHGNTGRPQDLFTDETLKNLFSTEFDGQTIEVSGPSKTINFVSTDAILNNDENNTQKLTVNTNEISNTVKREANTDINGSISKFGNYDFGNNKAIDNIVSSALQAIGGSKPLLNIVSGNFSGGLSQNSNNIAKLSSATEAAFGPNIHSVSGLAESINTAAKINNRSPLDETERSSGIDLSETATAIYNQSQDGTFMIGRRTEHE